MTRHPIPTTTIRLVGEVQRAAAIARIANLPVDPVKPIEVVFREEKKARTLDANARMWAGTLKDISEQAWVGGRQFSAETWHEFFKREFLPEDIDPSIDVLVKDGYRKWDVDPKGQRVLIGSTTQLTVKGFCRYLEQIECYGAELGVMFSESPHGARP